MATCRVYLTTYRRNLLLRRSVRSLLEQTFDDWICELHNDDPEDPFPGELVAELADPRITYHAHPENFGPVRSFNLFFQPIAEPFFSLLEDDNWWEPRLLETLLSTLGHHAEADLAWSNMRYWKEEADGSWTDTGRDIWNRRDWTQEVVFRWPDVRQVSAAIHSHGAMVVRSWPATMRPVPVSLPVYALEATRERFYTGGMVLVPHGLANFALTRTTAQKSSTTQNLQLDVLLACSFLRRVDAGHEFYAEVWRRAQGWPVRSSNVLVIASMLAGRWGLLARHSRTFDWLFFLASCLKRPQRMWRCFHAARMFPEVAEFLNATTSEVSRKNCSHLSV